MRDEEHSAENEGPDMARTCKNILVLEMSAGHRPAPSRVKEKEMQLIPDDPIIVSMMRTGYPPWYDDDEDDYDEPVAVYDPE